MINRTATRRTAATVLLGAGAALCVGAASPASTATTADPAVAATVAALVADDTVGALAAFPDGFAEVMGYHPSIEPGNTIDGVLTDPDGDCSSPVALPSDFEPACRSHDLGYDLLRYARDIGGELGPQARRDLDAHLQRNLNAACATGASEATGDVTEASEATGDVTEASEATGDVTEASEATGDVTEASEATGDVTAGVEPRCDVMAGIASAAVQINSWRQGYRLPESESPVPYLAAAGAAVVAGSTFLRRTNR
ncbi:hypothetical protein HCA61_01805 [Rhodococcus sp. HNM0563]|uniref:hypothetical protein n=1 Tax=Rhodococcus sp. HNM0563 TaxID=2716339 RepID=UPI00146B027B|nr:hypothetical protein [Rhodococcus sp. HNM0563]NLU60999.1 hypothetical protein [Rhodococcus sp. HNM0563]